MAQSTYSTAFPKAPARTCFFCVVLSLVGAAASGLVTVMSRPSLSVGKRVTARSLSEADMDEAKVLHDCPSSFGPDPRCSSRRRRCLRCVLSHPSYESWSGENMCIGAKEWEGYS